MYVGETQRNARKRGNEHIKQLKEKQESSALWKHCESQHEGIEQNFNMNVTGVHHNNSMEKQIAEAVIIRNKYEQNIKLINNKTEWNHSNLPTLTLQHWVDVHESVWMVCTVACHVDFTIFDFTFFPHSPMTFLQTLPDLILKSQSLLDEITVN